MPKSETTSTAIQFSKKRLKKETLLELYRQLLRPRMIEEKMLNLLRQGKISKWFSGIGQEAISVGAACALREDELLFTMHRNLGVFTAREVPLVRLFSQWQGKQSGYTKGRDRSFHFGAMDHNIVGMISHLGPQLSLAGGVGLAHKLRNEKSVSLAFTGEGATSEGEFHEALNVAAVWKLPVIFIIENNGYGLSTTTNEQFVCESLAERGKGYGMRYKTIDGNNILEVYQTIQKIADELRENPEPFLLECQTFRMRGHEEASGTKYVPKELMDAWAIKDPLNNYESWLLETGVLTETMRDEWRAEMKNEIQEAVNQTFELPEPEADTEQELRDLFAPFDNKPVDATGKMREVRFVDAVSEGLEEAMKKHPELVLMGQDIAEYGGVFKITDGFIDQFGKGRVRNTPLCESAILGIGQGLSLKGMKAMIEMQFADFVSCGFNQIVNNFAKLHWRWGQNVDVVVRMPTGGGMSAGPFHSQSNEAWFAHTPGLKIIYPATPYDAKGLLLAAFEDPNPVLFFEHKGLYRSENGMVPEGYYTLEIGKAQYARKGKEMTIITYGMGVRWALEAADELGIDAEIIDLRTLSPLDYDTIGESVRKTNRALILHEDTLFGGIGGEISAWVSEELFDHLDAPVLRAASLDTPVPFAAELEKNFMPVQRLRDQMLRLRDF